MSDEVGELPYYKVQDYETAMVYFPFAGLNQFCSGYIHVSRLWDAANKPDVLRIEPSTISMLGGLDCLASY